MCAAERHPGNNEYGDLSHTDSPTKGLQVCLLARLELQPTRIKQRNKKSADLACEFHGVISEPGAKTLAWPRGRRGGSAGEGGRGGEGPCFSTRGSREVWTVL